MTWRFEYFQTIESTSDYCKDRAENGELAFFAVQSYRQTAGRGTRGRAWSDPGGNLALSLLFRPADFADFVAALPFIIAVALYDAAMQSVSSLTSKSPFLLKWPNDLLLSERKMAGVLIETGGSKSHPWAVVGIGANLARAPEISGRVLAALSEVVETPCAKRFGVTLVDKIDRWVEAFERNGFGVIRSAWLERAHPLGTPLAVQGRETYITGSFAGLDAQGRLLLALPDGEIIPVVTGDILLD